MFIDIPAKPKVKHGEFPFELVYEYKGDKKTIKDTARHAEQSGVQRRNI